MRKACAVLQPFLGPLLLVALAVPSVQALEKPSTAEIARYRRDGSLNARRESAYALGNHRVKPGLAAAAVYRLQLDQWRKGQLLERPTPPSGWKGMPTTGNVKILALLIAFSDYASTNTAISIDGKLYGDGTGTAPYESVRNFYRRASYSQLEIGGSTLGWYTTAYPRSSVTQTYLGREALIKEALNSYEAAGHDFSQYDNDGDGAIDYFVVIWTGPDTGWGNFWWGYQTSFSDGSYRLDGKRLRDYSWQWESRPTGGTFNPIVVIHETGHALGLPDYYDYDDSVGPLGGVGGLDMMDGNRGDHNCFSKFLLDWLTPTVVSGGVNTVSLRSAGSFGDAVIFSKGATSQSFAEYFMVQNRTRTGNDITYPTDGLLIWHLDARLNPAATDYLYDNSYTAHKLLRLMEADGLEQIEANGTANAGDYYVTGKTLGPGTYPSIARYDSAPNPMLVSTISATGSPMTARIDEIVDATGPTGVPSTPTDEGATKAGDSLAFGWTQGTAADPDTGIVAYQLQVGTTPGGNDTFDSWVGNALTWTVTGGADGATYYARVRAMNATGLTTGWSGNSDGITVNLPVFPCAAVDNCGLVFKTAGSATWFEQAAVVYYGSTAAQGGDITDSQSTYLQTTLVGPGTLSFWWKVSSESGWDYLRFFVDGAASATPISGETAWAQQTLSIPAGTHLAQWKYTKDIVYSSGSDTGWVDRVQWTSPPSLSINDATVTEGNSGTTTATFTVTLSAASASAVTVNYATADGTATAGSDYVAGSGSLILAAGETSKPIPVTVNGDTTVESDETFTVNLSGASGATIADAQGVGTIANDDVPSYLLTVALAGTGTGSVSSNPTGIYCGADCTESYTSGTVVTLTASAEVGSVFSGWSGACSGTAVTCPVTMSGAQSVTATFALEPGIDFYTVAPCRVLDSRQLAGPWGGTPLAAGEERGLTLGGACGIPVTAQAVSINITAVDATTSGHLRIFPAGSPRPTTSVVNFPTGLTRANNAIVQLGSAAAVTLFSGQPAGTVHVVVDVNGWFE